MGGQGGNAAVMLGSSFALCGPDVSYCVESPDAILFTHQCNITFTEMLTEHPCECNEKGGRPQNTSGTKTSFSPHILDQLESPWRLSSD